MKETTVKAITVGLINPRIRPGMPQWDIEALRRQFGLRISSDNSPLHSALSPKPVAPNLNPPQSSHAVALLCTYTKVTEEGGGRRGLGKRFTALLVTAVALSACAEPVISVDCLNAALKPPPTEFVDEKLAIQTAPIIDRQPTSPHELGPSERQIDLNQLGFAAALLGVSMDSVQVDPSLTYPQLDGFLAIRANVNGRQVVMHNAATREFIKIDLSPAGTSLVLEARQMQQSVRIALNISEETAAEMVRLVRIPAEDGRLLLAVRSQQLGIPFSQALKEGLIPDEQIPALIEQLVQHADDVFKVTGRYNLDLNPGNVLIHFDARTGNHRVIIIDWINSATTTSTMKQATALRKFLSAFALKHREQVIARIMAGSESVQLKTVIAEILKREGVKAVLKTGATTGLVLLFLASTTHDAHAQAIEESQKGEYAHIDLAYLPLLASGVPEACAGKAFDLAQEPAGINTLEVLPFIPLTQELAGQMLKGLIEGEQKELVLNDFLRGGNNEHVPIFTGMLVGKGENGQLTLYDKETKQPIQDKDIRLFTIGVNEAGEQGYEVWNARVTAQYSFTDDKGNTRTVPYAIIPQRLVYFAPFDG